MEKSMLIFFSQNRSTFNDDDEINGPPSATSSLFRAAGTSGREQEAAGPTSAANPMFAVLKVTAFQQALGHPVAYARVLMQVMFHINIVSDIFIWFLFDFRFQLGYEPLPAYRGKTLFGKETLFYPNVFRYCKLSFLTCSSMKYSFYRIF